MIFFINFLMFLSLVLGKNIIRIDKLETCECGTPCISMNYQYKLTNKPREDTLVDMAFGLSRDVMSVKFEAEVTRCKSRENLDSCEYFTTLKPINTCELMERNGTMWSPLVYNVHPAFKCPMFKGNYVGKNLRMSGNKMFIFPLTDAYWKAKMIFRNGTSKKHELLWTLCVDGYVIKIH